VATPKQAGGKQALPTVTVKAEARWVRSSARKARIVLENVRGRTVPEARTILRFTQRHVATDIEKVLHSAVSNAEANHGLIGDELVIAAAYANEGPTLKRFRPRARGRASQILKRTCHITILLGEDPKADQRPRRRAGGTAAAATPTQESTGASAPKARKRKEAVA
jgi:large subunit ribosomal protein L22